LPFHIVEELKTIELAALQPDVEEQEIRPARRDGRERRVAVARGARLIALVLQDTGDQFANIRLVIDDQNIRRHHSPAAARISTASDGSVLMLLTFSAAKRRRTHAPRPPDATSGASNSSIRPPCSSRMRPTMARPRPVPFSRVVT